MRDRTTQTSLDLRGERLPSLWKQLPERCRAEAIAIWTQLIARVAQSPSRTKPKGAQR
jgi:hypothetical protein